MESYFSISEAAKIVGLTSETLRHYDRIDLVKPCKKINGQVIDIILSKKLFA
ncbi:MAG: MerR family DNA-binding transcriptional regulator [Acutalibacteraceae bacterium]